MKWHPTRLAVAVPLVVIAAFLAFYGGFIISIIFDDYKDSPDSTYLAVGGTSLAISALFATAALLTVSGAPHRLGCLVLAVLAFLASALPYASMVGEPGYAANAALALLAVGSVVAYLVGGGRGPASGPRQPTPLASARSFCETGEDVHTRGVLEVRRLLWRRC